MIVIDHRSPQQFVTDRAADQIDVHTGILPCGRSPARITSSLWYPFSPVTLIA
jgi:hypothetical protein